MQENNLIKEVLKTYFVAGAQLDYEELKKFLKNPAFPDRAEKFKAELGQAIRFSKIDPKEFENLTSVDLESQADVNQFLTTELWQPLYGEDKI